MLKEIKPSRFLLVIVICGVLIGGGIYYWKKTANEEVNEAESSQNLDNSSTSSTSQENQSGLDSGTSQDEIVSSSIKSIEVNSTVPTTSWKTFSEDSVGYSIKFPRDFKATGVDNTSMNFGSSSEGLSPLSIDIIKPALSQTLDEFVDYQTNNEHALSECRKAIVSENKAAYECLDLGLTSNYVVVSENNGVIFKLLFNTNKDSFFQNKAALTDIQKSMLASFKYTK